MRIEHPPLLCHTRKDLIEFFQAEPHLLRC